MLCEEEIVQRDIVAQAPAHQIPQKVIAGRPALGGLALGQQLLGGGGQGEQVLEQFLHKVLVVRFLFDGWSLLYHG